MSLPFTAQQFFDVFRRYNEGVWPAQFALVALAVLALLVLFRYGERSTPVVFPILGFFWIWMSFTYHAGYFATVNPAAKVFAVVFGVEAILLFWMGVIGHSVNLAVPRGVQAYAVLALSGYALILYPLLGSLSGQRYPEIPTFGAPCPTVIFTLAILAAVQPVRWILLVVPVLWSIIGASAAFALGVHQDLGLPLAALAVVVVASTRPQVLISKTH